MVCVPPGKISSLRIGRNRIIQREALPRLLNRKLPTTFGSDLTLELKGNDNHEIHSEAEDYDGCGVAVFQAVLPSRIEYNG